MALKLKLPSRKGLKAWFSGSGGRRLRKVGRISAWIVGVFSIMLTFVWLSLPTGAIAWRISHEARKAGYLVTVEDVSISPFGSITLERVTWDFLPSHPEQGTVPFYAEAVEVDIEIWKVLLLRRYDVDLDFDIEEGSLSANVNRGSEDMEIELEIEDLPLYGVPKFQQMMNAPVDGRFALKAEIRVPNNEFGQAQGFIEMSCKACLLGDGETKFFMPGARGMLEKGITIPQVKFGDLTGRFEIVDGVATAEEFASISDDLEIRVSGQMKLADPFTKSRLELMLKLLVSEALQKQDANFQLLVSTAREKAEMEPPNEGWLAFILGGPVAHPSFSGIKSKTKENNLRDKREARRKMLAERKKQAAQRKKKKAKKKKPAKAKPKVSPEPVKVQLAPTAEVPRPRAVPAPAPPPDAQAQEGGGQGGEEGNDAEEAEEVEEEVEEEPEEAEEEPEDAEEEPEEEGEQEEAGGEEEGEGELPQ